MIFQNDLLRIMQGSGGSDRTQRPDGNLAFSSAVQGNGADTTDDVLFNYAIPTNLLDHPGADINITALGNFAATANNKRVKLFVGATTVTPGLAIVGGVLIADSGVVTVNNGGWILNGSMFKTGAFGSNTQKALGFVTATGFVAGTLAAVVQLTQVESAVINFTVTGASPTTGAANDVVLQVAQVEITN